MNLIRNCKNWLQSHLCKKTTSSSSEKMWRHNIICIQARHSALMETIPRLVLTSFQSSYPQPWRSSPRYISASHLRYSKVSSTVCIHSTPVADLVNNSLSQWRISLYQVHISLLQVLVSLSQVSAFLRFISASSYRHLSASPRYISALLGPNQPIPGTQKWILRTHQSL